MKIWLLLALSICLLTIGIFGLSQMESGRHSRGMLSSSKSSELSISQVSDRLHKQLEKPLINPRIIISKSKRRLELYCDSTIVRSYRIGLGFQPIGDKVREGDGRTPEGNYYVCVKNPKSRYYLSLGLSYPNIRDAKRGLREGLISHKQYNEIVQAIRNRRIPPWNTALGGEIFIHGHGSKSDWTLGCIALNDSDIHELYEAISIGTPVEIQP